MAQVNPATITYLNPDAGLNTTVNIPPTIVDMLIWLAANVKNPDGTPRYKQEADVIYRDAIEKLVPSWTQAYQEGSIAVLQADLDAKRKTLLTAIDNGLSDLISQ